MKTRTDSRPAARQPRPHDAYGQITLTEYLATILCNAQDGLQFSENDEMDEVLQAIAHDAKIAIRQLEVIAKTNREVQ